MTHGIFQIFDVACQETSDATDRQEVLYESIATVRFGFASGIVLKRKCFALDQIAYCLPALSAIALSAQVRRSYRVTLLSANLGEPTPLSLVQALATIYYRQKLITRNSRSKPWVFSLLPCCQGLRGSQK